MEMTLKDIENRLNAQEGGRPRRLKRMSEDPRDLPLRVALAVRNGLASIVEQLNDILKGCTPAEVKWNEVHSIEADGQILADFLVNPDRARLQPNVT